MIPFAKVILIIHGTEAHNCAIFTFDSIEAARTKDAELRFNNGYTGLSSIYERIN